MEIQNFRHYNRETNDVKYTLPTTLMKRPGYNTSGKEINTQINSFPIIKYPTITVYQYDVSLSSTFSESHRPSTLRVGRPNLENEYPLTST